MIHQMLYKQFNRFAVIFLRISEFGCVSSRTDCGNITILFFQVNDGSSYRALDTKLVKESQSQNRKEQKKSSRIYSVHPIGVLKYLGIIIHLNHIGSIVYNQ